MNKVFAIAALCLACTGPSFGGSNPPIPSPEPGFTDPGTPEARRAYRIAVLENEIAQDQYVIANPGGGKPTDAASRVKVAKENLKLNQDLLAKVKAGADMEVYFCSQCGREYMKTGTCPHCKKTLAPMFQPGTKRSPVMPMVQ